MIRVLHLVISFAPGGRREAIRTLVQGQQSHGVRSDLCCLDFLGCEEAAVADEFDQHLMLSRRGLFDLSSLVRLARYCDARQVHIIHAHDAASQALAALLHLLRPRIKLLMTFHRTRGFESETSTDRLRNLLAATQCGAVVVGSRERRAHFLGENFVPARKVLRIPFGVDVERFRPDPVVRRRIRMELGLNDDTLVLGAVGHFGDEKGIDVVLRAFHELVQRLPSTADVKLIVLGSGMPGRQELIKQIAGMLPPERVVLLGFRADVEQWFNAMDVFVHAPRNEAFGLAVVEAMATRLPVIATAVGGIPDIVRDGKTGLLVPSEDFAALAEALHRLSADPELRSRLGTQGLHIAKTCFSSELYALRYSALYHDLVSGSPLRAIDDWGRSPVQSAAAAGEHVPAAAHFLLTPENK